MNSEPLSKAETESLIASARESRDHAFVVRSGHKIGAAILTTSDEVFGGCNTEAYITGLGTCAERSAVDHAVAHGKYNFRAVVTVDSELTYPCGACLQYLLQFYQISGEDIYIIVADLSGNSEIKSLMECLPYGYLTKSNLEKLRDYESAKHTSRG